MAPVLAGAVLREAPAAEPGRSPSPSVTASAGNAVQRVDYAVLGGRTLIRLTFRNVLQERPNVLKTFHPNASLVLDFPNAGNESGNETMEMNQRDLRGIQLIAGSGRLRVLVTLGRVVPHELEVNGNEVLLTLQRPLPGVP